MSDTKHTPEPWIVKAGPHENEHIIIAGNSQPGEKRIAEGLMRGETYGKADADRIVACVNAMAGIDNPETFMQVVKQLRLDQCDKLEAKVKKLEDQIRQQEKYLDQRNKLYERLKMLWFLLDQKAEHERQRADRNQWSLQEKLDWEFLMKALPEEMNQSKALLEYIKQ
ncbi:MAG: hypothetical protein JNM00_06890 [Flavobacteriales bacterium]|nr:hypothetical protein [Flavobacteriales bacterium]